MKHKYTIRILLLFLFLSFSSIVFSESSEDVSLSNLPPYYPEYFENAAVLTGVDRKNSRLIFGATHVSYDQNIQIRLLTTEFGTIEQLAPGTPIAFSTNGISYKNGKIKQVWQLPAGTIPAH